MRAGTTVGLVALLAACGQSDDELYIGYAQRPLAERSFFPLRVVDACDGGGGKGDVCSNEQVVELTAFSSDDPEIVEVVRGSDVPLAGFALDELALAAHRAGTTTIRVSARFDDGSERSSSTEVQVLAPDRVELGHICRMEAERLDLIPSKSANRMGAKLYAGDTELAGAIPELLEVDSPSVSLVKTLGEGNAYEITPSAPGPLRITSSLDEKLRVELEAYGPDDFDALALAEVRSNSERDAVLYFDMTIGGQLPCQGMRLTIQTLTPELCGGRDGTEHWTDVNAGVALVRPIGTGTCRISVRPEGAREGQTVELAVPLAD